MLVPRPTSDRNSGQLQQRSFDPVDLLTVGYLLVVALTTAVLGGDIEYQVPLVTLHLALAFFILLLVPKARRSASSAARFAADWYSMPLFALLYVTCNMVNTIFFVEPFDEFFRGLDRTLFGVEPSFWLAETFGSPVLDELIHACYAAYYLLIPGVGLALYWRNRSVFRRYLFTVCWTLYVSFLVFIVLPVHGPLTERGDDYSGFLFVPLMDVIYGTEVAGLKVECGGGAFPSSHVAAGLVCLLFLRHRGPGYFWCALPVVAGLVLATVYCRYHYAVDSIAGLAWGGLLFWLAKRLYPRL